MKSDPEQFARITSIAKGVAATELAIALPLLILILLGACDFGRFAHTQVAVAGAARAGAGIGSQRSPTPTTQGQWNGMIRTAVEGELQGLIGFQAQRLTTTITLSAETGGTQRVSVQANYPFRTLVNWGVIPSEINCRETVVFRISR